MDPLSITERCQVRNPANNLQCRKPAGHETGSDPLHGPRQEELDALNAHAAVLCPFHDPETGIRCRKWIHDADIPHAVDNPLADPKHPPPVIDPRQTSLFEAFVA